MSTLIHPTAIVEEDVRIGPGTALWDHVHVRHASSIGTESIVGEKTYIAYGVSIGSRVKINANVYICTGVSIEDGVMVGAHTVFTNDRFPRAATPDLQKLRPSETNENTPQTRVGRGATIGAASVVGPGITIGDFAMVGMGSVLTRSVEPYHLVYGNPARPAGCVCRCGLLIAHFTSKREHYEHLCLACGTAFTIDGTRVRELHVSELHIAGG